MKNVLTGLLCLLITMSIQAQTDLEALKFSQLDYIGSAKFNAVGGALGSIGADFSAASINPAGLVQYRENAFETTLNFYTIDTDARFIGNTSSALQQKVNFNSTGLVFVGDDGSKKGWNAISIGFGMNRLADYNSKVYYTGYNTENSRLDYWAEKLNQNGGTNADDIASRHPFDINLAYQTYLLNPQAADSTKYDALVVNGDINQSQSTQTKGSNREFVFAIAGKFEDRISMGATIGVPLINYVRSSSYIEEDVNDKHPDFHDFEYLEQLSIYGLGINLKLGGIVKLNDIAKIGLAFHSPTSYSMSEVYASDLNSNNGGEYLVESSPRNSFDYTYFTPARFILSGSMILNKRGFVSVDFETVDYGAMQYSFSGSADRIYENQLNQAIGNKYTTANILRVGAEYTFGPIALRTGVKYETSPFQSTTLTSEIDQSKLTIGGGIGMKFDNLYFDFTYTRASFGALEVPYTLNSPDETTPGAILIENRTNFNVGMSIKF